MPTFFVKYSSMEVNLFQTFKTNVVSGWKKVSSFSGEPLTADEKAHLGFLAGVVALTTAIVATYTYRSSSSSASTTKTSTAATTTTNNTNQLSGSADKVVTILPAVAPTTGAAPTELEIVEAGLQKDTRPRLAASPSSDEDQEKNTVATPSTARHMEFDAPGSSTTSTTASGSGTGTGTDASMGSDSEDNEDEEYEDEQRELTLDEALLLMKQLLAALDTYHDDTMVATYGSFVSCLISMQKVFQRFDWGYAEWPDVVSSLDAHSDNSDYAAKWNELQEKLQQLGFPNIPIFNEDLTVEQLLQVMEQMLSASQKVANSVQKLKKEGDSIIDAHHEFNEKKTRASYEEWRRQCTPDEFRAVAESATFPTEDTVSVPRRHLKEWKDQYLVRVMLTMMTPLTKLQEDNMKEYGIGATHFQQQVWKHAGDADVARIKHDLEYMMTQIHPTASDTEDTSGSDSTY